MNGFDISTISELYVGSTPYSAIYKGSTLLWQATLDYSKEYFTIESLTDNNNIKFKASSSDLTKTIEWSTNKVNWTSVTSSTVEEDAIFTTLNTNEKIYIRGNNTQYATGTNSYNYFICSGYHKVSGNIMSLLYGSNFKNQYTLESSRTFYKLFHSDIRCVDASNLILPATTLTSYCYGNMFQNCTALTTAPTLPATTLADNCYYCMFYDCTSLTTAPELSATTLADYCYGNMFYNCESLTTAPELPATTLTHYCYGSMFQGCTSLTTAPELPATTLDDYCYYAMFYGCTSLTTTPELPATTLVDYCYTAIFQGCTSLTTAPTLPATTLATQCYRQMFQGCTSLTTAPELPATTLATQCYYGMFQGCTSLTTAPTLQATTLAPTCCRQMFQDCTSLTTAPALPATTLANYCYYCMFQNCTALTTAPTLPATTLADNCYRYMFRYCSKLNYIKMLATNISATSCLNNWVNGVSGSGTFVKNINATWTTTGVSGIPSGWTVQNYEPTVSDNASIKIYTNYLTNGSNYISTGTNLTIGANQNAWHYGNNKYIRFVHGSATSSMGNCDKYNMVITGFTQFKILTVPNQYTSNICHFALSKIGDNTSIKYNNLSSSNEHVQVYMSKSSSEIEYIYTNLDPNTKYNISIYYQNNSNNNTNIGFLIPSSYPNFTLVEASFSSSSDYTEIYG